MTKSPSIKELIFWPVPNKDEVAFRSRSLLQRFNYQHASRSTDLHMLPPISLRKNPEGLKKIQFYTDVLHYTGSNDLPNIYLKIDVLERYRSNCRAKS